MPKCFDCGKSSIFTDNFKKKKVIKKIANNIYSDELLNRMNEESWLCLKCCETLDIRHAKEIDKFYRETQTPAQYEQFMSNPSNQYLVNAIKQNQISDRNDVSHIPLNLESSHSKNEVTPEENDVTSARKLRAIAVNFTPDYKEEWDKNGVVQFKNERIAILQRMWGAQVQFIVAFDQLTKEGYRCVAHDEGKTGGQSSGGFTGGVNSYFYFQKIDLVR